MTISDEEYAVWLENPVTQWVLAGVERYSARQQASFTEAMWNGQDDPTTWAELRLFRARAKERALAYEGLANLTYDQAAGLHEEDATDGR